MRTHRTTAAFSLLELMIVMALLSVFGLLAFVAVSSAAETTVLADAKTQAQSDVRQALALMANELQLASKTPNPSLTPPLEAVRINRNVSANVPVEIVFQTPVDGSGGRWSRPIRYQFFTEDLNGNNRLDPGEDIDGDGVLSRRIIRLQDLNGDGTFDGPGERVQVGTANNLAEVDFELVGSRVTITATARKLIGNRDNFPASSTAATTIYLMN